MNEIIANLFDRVKTAYGINAKQLNRNYYLVKNHCVLGDYLTASLMQFIKHGKNFLFSDSGVWLNEQCSEAAKDNVIVNGNIYSMPENSIMVFVINCMDQRYKDQEEREKALEVFQQGCKRFCKKGLVVGCIIVPQPEDCPEGITALAEREYNYYLAIKEQLTWQESFYLQLENTMRNACVTDKSGLIMLRFTNILGPMCHELVQSLDVNEIYLTAKNRHTISLSQTDSAVQFSYISLANALYAVLITIANPRRLLGHVVNVSTEKATKLDVKWALYRAYQKEMILEGCTVDKPIASCCGLSSLYFSGLFPAVKIVKPSLEEVMYQIGCCEFGYPYDIMRKLKVYEGRLPFIRETEMKMLKVIDQICRDNGIQYFLAGGTALGAVRHQDMIPWDDDIDIGMLREDYEKFRKVVPTLLPEEMTYEASNGVTKSHYHFDKIRLKETWFSTRYSSNFCIPDGVFIDILVYDNTSNRRMLQKLHIRLTTVWTRVLNVKWINKPRKKIHNKASILALPVMRCISWKWFHWVFERIVRLYENKKNAQYVIDSVGQNIKKGAMQREWMTEVEYIPFGDMMAPVPKDYDKYLRHFYGANYMNMLPIDRRVSGHKIARLDLGRILFHSKHEGRCVRKLDIRGMLYEKNQEEIQ